MKRSMALISPALCAAAVPLVALTGAHACVLRLVGENFDLTSEPVTQRLAPAPAYNSVLNEYMVVWFDTRNPGSNDVFGQRADADGNLIGSNFPIIEFA